MPAIYKPLSANGLLKPAGQVGVQLLGKKTITPFGHATLTFKQSSTKSDIRTPESPGREVIATDYSEFTGSFDIEFSNLNDLGLALAFAANVKPFEQEAVASRDQVFEGARVLDWMELLENDEPGAQGLVNTVVTAVKVGGVALPPAAYRHDSKGGAVQITLWPEGADTFEDVTVTFSAPEVVMGGSGGASVAELLQNIVVRGRLLCRQNNIRGVNRKVIAPQVAFGGDGGEVSLIQDGTDIVKVKVSGSMEADYTQPPGREFGYLVDLV